VDGPEDQEVNLRRVSDEEIFGEIRRRRLPQYQVRDALDIQDPPQLTIPGQRDLRLWALVILGVLTLVLVGLIGTLSSQSKDIPDLLSALAGSGVGGIAGILSGGAGGGETTGPAAEPPLAA
jgi:hypothetical protein